MTGQTITVFGGSGFVGRYVVARLAARGWVIRVAVRRASRANFLRPLGLVGQVTPVPCDVTNQASVARALAGADAAVNLVGILQEQGSQTFEKVHHQGSRNIAEAAKAAGIERLVHISAIGADANSSASYGRTKAAAESAVRAAVPTAVIFRPSVIFGPEDQFFNRFAAMSRIAPALPLIGGGKTRFQPVYVADVADAVLAGIERPELAGETFELGGPRTYSFRDLMVCMLRIVERKRRLVPISFGTAKLIAGLTGWMPQPPITGDQIEMLKHDNVVADGAKGFAALGISPHSVEVILPTYLDRFRPYGRFTRPAQTMQP
mgnify:CR=1 FL=1